MNTTVTARHCEISDELKHRAVELIDRAAKVAARPLSADVIFDADHGTKVVELKLSLPRGVVKVATAEADDFRSALDRAGEKLRHQLDRESRKASHRP